MLKTLDVPYVNTLRSVYAQLESSYENMRSNYTFDLNTTQVSEAILERMKAYYFTQEKIKTFLDKKYLTAASDFFVESTLFYLKLYLQSKGGKLKAFSEKQIRPKKNAIRPDISIWEGERIVATIECKTQLGWNRDGWEKEYLDRDKKLKRYFPDAQSFLLVMTGSNWSGFGNHENLNMKFFCLLSDIWPIMYENPSQILTPIEGLFSQLC